MTFFGRFPSSALITASRAKTAASISAFPASRATVTSARFLPLIWTGKVMVFSTSKSGSTCGQAFRGNQGPVAERRPAFLGQMRHHRVEQPHQDVAGLATAQAKSGEGAASVEPMASESALANS